MNSLFSIGNLIGKKDKKLSDNSCDIDFDETVEEEVESLSDILSMLEEEEGVFDITNDPQLMEVARADKKTKALRINIEQMEKFAIESNSNISTLLTYMETAKLDAMQRVQFAAENANLRRDMLKLTSEHRRLTQDLEKSNSELSVLKTNRAELQNTLTETRESINSMRHSNKKMSDEFRASIVENTELKQKLADLTDAKGALQKRFEAIDEQCFEFKSELEGAAKKILEYEALIKQKDDAIIIQSDENKSFASDLAISNRQFKELQDEKIAIEEKLDLEQENLNHIKRISEQDQRKHDNETFALRSQIENITTQLSHAKAANKEISHEIRTLREHSRKSKLRIEELEMELEAVQDTREKHQDDFLEQGAKFRELNLQYESVLLELKQEQLQVAQLNKKIKQLTDETRKVNNLRVSHDSALAEIKELKSRIQGDQIAIKTDLTLN